MKLFIDCFQRLQLDRGGGYPVLIALAALMDVRRTIASAVMAQGSEGQALYDGLDYMLLAEWLVILAATKDVDWSRIKAGACERLFGLAVVATGLFGVTPTSHWLTMAICCAIAARLFVEPSARRLSAVLVIVASQYVLSQGPFVAVHEVFAQADAWATHHLLTAADFANALDGTIVKLQGSSFAIVISPGCATTSILPRVGGAFLIFALCWRASVRSVVLGLVVTLGACLVLNLLRLSVMAMSPDDYQYWHNGGGRPIVSVTMTAIAYLTAAAVVRRDALLKTGGAAAAVAEPGA